MAAHGGNNNNTHTHTHTHPLSLFHSLVELRVERVWPPKAWKQLPAVPFSSDQRAGGVALGFMVVGQAFNHIGKLAHLDRNVDIETVLLRPNQAHSIR